MSSNHHSSSDPRSSILRRPRKLRDHCGATVLRLISDEEGMSTAEYAIGTIAAAAFGAILYTVITGDSIVSALTGIIDKALNTSVG